jgi:hypothetical protein
MENIRYRINEHAVSTLFNLASSDILIGSRSSYSYAAAVAGTARCVIMPPFWHALLPNWIESNPETGNFHAGKTCALLTSCETGRDATDMAPQAVFNV